MKRAIGCDSSAGLLSQSLYIVLQIKVIDKTKICVFINNDSGILGKKSFDLSVRSSDALPLSYRYVIKLATLGGPRPVYQKEEMSKDGILAIVMQKMANFKP